MKRNFVHYVFARGNGLHIVTKRCLEMSLMRGILQIGVKSD